MRRGFAVLHAKESSLPALHHTPLSVPHQWPPTLGGGPPPLRGASSSTSTPGEKGQLLEAWSQYCGNAHAAGTVTQFRGGDALRGSTSTTGLPARPEVWVLVMEAITCWRWLSQPYVSALWVSAAG